MKKIIAMLLVLAMCLTSVALIASCGDPKDPAQSSSSPTPDKPDDPDGPDDQNPPHTHNFVEGKCECGETDPDYVPPHTHTFVEGKCECGETDPNYVPSTPDRVPELEDENGVMIYYQNFDAITGADNAAILEQLGWKGAINHKYKDDTQIAFGAASLFKQNGTSQCQKCVLMPYFENTGMRTNMSLLSVDNGFLKIDNETANPNGAWATFEILPDGALDAAKASGSFTVQYDIKYDVTTTKSGADNLNMWAGVVAYAGLSDSRLALGGTHAQIFADGTVRPMYGYAHFLHSLEAQGATNNALKGSVLTSAQICDQLFGAGTTSFEQKTMTVRIVYVTSDEWTRTEMMNGESVTLGKGMHIYIKAYGQSDYTLVSTTEYYKDRFLYSAMNCGDLTFVLAGAFENTYVSGTNNSWIGMYSWGNNTTNDAPVEKDGKTYESYYQEHYDASGIVYLDNFAVWYGSGNMPANKTPGTIHEHNFVEGKCECGETDPNYVPPHTHNFVEGKCECGETDPNYVPSTPTPTPDAEDPNGVMLYYQNFDAVTGTDNASILAQLGWVDNVNDQTDPIGSKNGTTDSAGAVLAPNWSNVGLSTNMALLSVTDGVLKIDNKTNNPNGAYSTFAILGGLSLTDKDYTIQYDITYEDASDYMWAGFVLNNEKAVVGASRSNLNGTYARIYQNGRVELLYQNGHAYHTIANEKITGTVVEAGTLCETLFGAGTTTMKSKTITVKLVYKNVAEEGEGAMSKGIYVYVKEKGAAEFTLASYTTHTRVAVKVAFVLGGSYDNNQGQENSIIGDLAFRQNTTNKDPITIDGTTYEAYYTPENDASGIVYLDNIAVWEGTGNIPANKTPAN